MAIKLYRAGTSHHVNGIDCEVRMFRSSAQSLDFVGVDGWCKSPEDINKESETKKSKKAKKKIEGKLSGEGA